MGCVVSVKEGEQLPLLGTVTRKTASDQELAYHLPMMAEEWRTYALQVDRYMKQPDVPEYISPVTNSISLLDQCIACDALTTIILDVMPKPPPINYKVALYNCINQSLGSTVRKGQFNLVRWILSLFMEEVIRRCQGIDRFSFVQIVSNEVDIKSCNSLFNQHYGFWRGTATAVEMNCKRYQQTFFFDPSKCSGIIARNNGRLVGCALVYRDKLSKGGTVAWITQLVVHRDYRRLGIATEMIRLAQSCEDKWIGLVSAHPCAVKALESATQRRVDPEYLSHHYREFFPAIQVSYLKDSTVGCDEKECAVDTHFDVDRSSVSKIVDNIADWKLGRRLKPGHEYFGFVSMNQSLT